MSISSLYRTVIICFKYPTDRHCKLAAIFCIFWAIFCLLWAK